MIAELSIRTDDKGVKKIQMVREHTIEEMKDRAFGLRAEADRIDAAIAEAEKSGGASAA